ncbi:hypothetical protein EVAR_47584_1 [Eumeta japonica]|uniref:Uncharacterized protein n=1 Tax=Eumeta variegata TaxID=151549 RepID=A0A4C1WRJ1_EUMVA|nr:hypothetical protein EVAR_47584_1 [Eumeta japonica]
MRTFAAVLLGGRRGGFVLACDSSLFLRLPWLSRVTGNQGSIPEREPEKRLPHPRKAAGAQITHSRHGELHLCAALSVHRTRGATDTPAEHIVGEPFRGRSRIGTRRFNLQNLSRCS